MRARRFVSGGFAVAAAMLVLPAMAADYPVLRGTHAPSLPPAPVIESAPAADFNGLYFGGLAGFSTFNFESTRGPNQLVANNVRNSRQEEVMRLSDFINVPAFSSRGSSFGAFVGYNAQFDDAIVGLELDYLRLGRRGSGSDSITRTAIVDGVLNTATVTGRTEARVDDLYSFRLRAGYAMGSVMFYATGGLAVGYGTVNHAATVNVAFANGDPPYVSGQLSDGRRRAVMLGYTGGLGAEALLGGLLLRGEYLYTRLIGPGSVAVDVNQARLGAGVKF